MILVVCKLLWNPSWFQLTTGFIWAQVRKFDCFSYCFCTCALINWSVLWQFLSLCLDFAWYLGCSLVFLGSCLWCWSSDHHVAFVQVTSCTLLNYKTITCKFISPTWLCWSSNTKIQSKWAFGPFPYNLSVFGDWWQQDQSKQIIKFWNLKTTYLLGCKAWGKVIWC